MDYNLEALGPDRFQELAQALLVREYPSVRCYPISQRDGGRDAVRPNGGAADGWYVYQVKFSEKPLDGRSAVKWLEATLKKEAPKVRELAAKGATRYHLITNLKGSAASGVGAMDRVAEIMEDVLGLPGECWWRPDINRRLDNAWDVKWAYSEIMAATDILRLLFEQGLSEDRQRRTRAIRAFLAEQYHRDEEVRFKQVELQNRLLDLFVDVPVAVAHEHGSQHARAQAQVVLRAVSGSSEVQFLELEQLDESNAVANMRDAEVGAATFLLDDRTQRHVPLVVVEGAPGQGKSTLAQYVCQVHRIKLLDKTDDIAELPDEHRARAVRLPFRVDLRDYAKWLARRNPFTPNPDDPPPENWKSTLEAFLAAQVEYLSGGVGFSVSDLHAVAEISPLLVVLDGLDEVADIEVRAAAIIEVEQAARRLSEVAAAVQIIVTSRPAAFANSPGISDRSFTYCTLTPLPRPMIEAYTERWLAAKRIEAREASEFRTALRQRLDQPHLRDLSRNPMQLAILLGLIRARGASLPDKRTALYDAYMDLFFNRESEKSEVVRNNRDLLISIHQYLGWLLQSEAQSGASNGAITYERLRDVVRTYLEEGDHPVRRLDELFKGMVERVVALVSRVEGTLEFEVQPLREYFAARFLYETAPYSPPGGERRGTRPDRLRALVRDLYWLNVARFYAGCHSVGELPAVAEELRELVSSEDLGSTRHPRALCVMLLSDWVFKQDPRSRNRVVEAMLDGPRWRLLLSHGRHSISGTDTILPEEQGRDELVQRALDVLLMSPPVDYALECVAIVRANLTSEAIKTAWFAQLPAAADRRGLWWLQASWLQALGAASDAEISRAIGDSPLEPWRLMLVLAAGNVDYVANEPARVSAVLNSLLDGEAYPGIAPSPADPLSALGVVLDLDTYASPSLVEWYMGRIDGMRLPQPRGDEQMKAASQFVEQWLQSWRAQTSFWRGDNSRTWEALEFARALWGERWGLQRLAIIAGMGAARVADARSANLMDQTVPLVLRTRFARSQAGRFGWWAKQLDMADSEQERLFVAAAVASYGGPTVLSRLMPRLEPLLADLGSIRQKEIRAIVRVVSGWRSRSLALKLPRTHMLTPALAGVLYDRLDRRTKTEVVEHVFRSDDGDRYHEQLRIDAMIEASVRNATDWQQLLKEVRGAYVRRISVSAGSLERSIRVHGAEISRILPLDIADQILTDPEVFPSAFVVAAEGRRRLEAGRELTPVPTIAVRDRWFERTTI